jgi:AcrR family transcriptional regulator
MSPRKQADNDAIRTIRRNQILFAAARQFAAQGLAATRMQDIARAAGISPGLAYHYFPSKEDLYIEIVGLAIGASLDSFRQAAVAPGYGLARLRGLLHAIFPHAFQNEGAAFFHIMIQVMTMESVPAQTRERLRRSWPEYQAQLAGIFRAGQADGSIRPDPVDQQVLVLCSILQGASVLAFVGGSDSPVLPDPETIARMFAASNKE